MPADHPSNQYVEHDREVSRLSQASLKNQIK